MAKNNNNVPNRSSRQLREISDYYKLNTKAVEDLVGASKENSPEVPREELEKYRTKSRIPLPRWLKAVLLRPGLPGQPASLSSGDWGFTSPTCWT